MLQKFSLSRTVAAARASQWTPIALAFAFFLCHAWLYRAWIIDDAGISFAYARNLAAGNGLVAQPGMLPVEGFSNLSWVLLIAPFFSAGIFDPVIVPKLVSLALVLATFITIGQLMRLTTSYPAIGAATVLTFLALNTSFVIWTTSGLENPLYVLLISQLLLQTIRLRSAEANDLKRVAWSSILIALCALTRPDGAIYAFIVPVLFCMELLSGKQKSREFLMALAVYALVFTLLFGSYVAFRYAYFGDLLPNTYYAKGSGLSISFYEWRDKLLALASSVGLNPLRALAFTGLTIYLARSKRLDEHFPPLITLLLFAIAAYLLLPVDWMPEFRFATPLIVMVYVTMYYLLERSCRMIAFRVPRLIMAGTVVIILGAASLPSFAARSRAFADAPTVPFSLVANIYGHEFNSFSLRLGIKDGSLLTPDLGGTLYYSDLRVYDLAGLTDKVVARSLGQHQDIFYDYVFDKIRPTFIHTHEWWAFVSNFDADPRFRRDYQPIDEHLDTWVLQKMGLRMNSGDYVRKDAIRNIDEFRRLQAEVKEH